MPLRHHLQLRWDVGPPPEQERRRRRGQRRQPGRINVPGRLASEFHEAHMKGAGRGRGGGGRRKGDRGEYGGIGTCSHLWNRASSQKKAQHLLTLSHRKRKRGREAETFTLCSLCSPVAVALYDYEALAEDDTDNLDFDEGDMSR